VKGDVLLGYYDRGGKLVFAGKAGTGFSSKLGRDLAERLRRTSGPILHSPRSRANTFVAPTG
jgi:hypothetical protein